MKLKFDLSKDLVKGRLDVVANVWPDVDVYASGVGEQFFHEEQPANQHFQVRIQSAAPSISIGFLLH